MKKLVQIADLKVGMYVSAITKSTENLVVKSQGMIRTQATIDSLKSRGILEFEIDFSKSECSEEDLKALNATEEEIKTQQNNKIRAPNAPIRKSQPLKVISFEQHQKDLAQADRLYSEAREIQGKFVKQLKGSQVPDFDPLNLLSQEIIDKVFDNPQALACLVMLKESNEYLVEHALNCAILLSMLAVHKGYSQAEVEDLTVAGLLMDCGMTLLPAELIKKSSSFSEADFVLMQTHVDVGIEIVERFSDVPPIVLDVIANHHERVDGSGYPKKKTADDISEFAKMAAIIDSYDAMLTDKPYRSSTTAHEALKLLQQDDGLDQDLVEDFIKAIGLFPVGSLVHLQSGKLAIVVKRNLDFPLDPVVMAFYSVRSKKNVEMKRIDLQKQSADKIVGSVTPEEFDLNLPKFFRSALLPF